MSLGRYVRRRRSRKAMDRRRVVVTGVGPITPIGQGKSAFWQSLREGRSGVQNVNDLIDLSGVDVRIGAPIRDFDPHHYMDRRRARRIDRTVQFALAAARLAFNDAGKETAGRSPGRTGVVVGTGIGGLQTMEESFAVLAERGP